MPYAFMSPEVGQRIEYVLTQPDESYRWSREILSIGEKRFAMRSEKLYSGTTEWTDRRTTYWTFGSLESTATLLDDCEGSGGARETVAVPAGTFATCRIETENGSFRKVTYWWGDVPVLGLVKREIVLKDDTGSTQTVELSKIQPQKAHTP